MQRPTYHGTLRTGYIYETDQTFWFLSRGDDDRLQVDRWSMNAIHTGQMRLYKLYDPPPYYSRYTYATVHNDSTMVFYEPWSLLAGSLSHLDFTLQDNEAIRTYIFSMDPQTTDLYYRNRSQSVPLSPPAPPRPLSPRPSPIASLIPPSPPQLIDHNLSIDDPLVLTSLEPLLPNNNSPLHSLATLASLAPPPLIIPALESPWDVDDSRDFDDASTIDESNTRESSNPYFTNSFLSSISTTLQAASMLSEIVNQFRRTENIQENKNIAKPNKRVSNIVIADAIKEKLSCPITLYPLTQETATCVAPCYHVFDKTAIESWLKQKNTCPECREYCTL